MTDCHRLGRERGGGSGGAEAQTTKSAARQAAAKGGRGRDGRGRLDNGGKQVWAGAAECGLTGVAGSSLF